MQVDSGELVAFSRRIVVTPQSVSSEYAIDGAVVAFGAYSLALKELHILTQARNFLVFQGDVEQVAAQSGRDLTRMVEQVCGSAALQQEYERLKDDQLKATEHSTFNFNKKRGINAEIRQYKE